VGLEPATPNSSGEVTRSIAVPEIGHELSMGLSDLEETGETVFLAII